MHGYGPPGNGFGPVEMLGILLLASLAFGLILWMTQQRRPVREGIAPSFEQQRLWKGEHVPELPPQVRSSPPAVFQTSYEQPQAHYPDMPYEGTQAKRLFEPTSGPQAHYPDMPYEGPQRERPQAQYPEAPE